MGGGSRGGRKRSLCSLSAEGARSAEGGGSARFARCPLGVHGVPKGAEAGALRPVRLGEHGVPISRRLRFSA